MSTKWGLAFKVKLARQFNDEVKCWLLKEKHKESGIGCNWLIESFWPSLKTLEFMLMGED